jgi:hypothetical protein
VSVRTFTTRKKGSETHKEKKMRDHWLNKWEKFKDENEEKVKQYNAEALNNTANTSNNIRNPNNNNKLRDHTNGNKTLTTGETK